jgi:hypothetical protein
MSTQEHGHAAIVANLTDQGAEFYHLVVIEAAGGFIQEQQLGLDRERARQLDPFYAERQLEDTVLATPLSADIDDFPGLFLQRRVLRFTQGGARASGNRCGCGDGRRP